MTDQRSNPGSGSGSPRYPGTFLLAFKEAVASLNWQTRRWLGSAVECVDAEGQEQVVGLENLFRRLRGDDRATWPDLIVSFLKSGPGELLIESATDLAAVADRLLLRLGPPLATKQDGKKIWCQPLVEGVLAVFLVIDHANSMSYVSEQTVLESTHPGEYWAGQAMANLHARTPADCLQVLHEDSGLRQCTVGDAYDSSRALLLEQLLPEEQRHGHFVILPARDLLLLLPVRRESLDQVSALKALAAKNFRGAPYPITDELFWIRQGSWHRFSLKTQGDAMSIEPPQEFLEVLKELVPDHPQPE